MCARSDGDQRADREPEIVASSGRENDLPGRVAQRPSVEHEIINGPAGARAPDERLRRQRHPGARPATVTSAKGPAAAADTPELRCSQRGCDALTAGLIVATMSAPRCVANAWSNGAFESTTSASASTVDGRRDEHDERDHDRLQPPTG